MESVISEEIQERYVVVGKTLALIPVFDLEIRTMIYEANHKFVFSKQTPLEIIEDACLDGGSSMNGRITYVRKVIGIYRRNPIPINEAEGIYAFPTVSQRRADNCWIFYSHVRKRTIDKKTGEGVVLFYDGQQLPIGVSPNRLQQQIYKASRCKSICEKRLRRNR